LESRVCTSIDSADLAPVVRPSRFPGYQHDEGEANNHEKYVLLLGNYNNCKTSDNDP